MYVAIRHHVVNPKCEGISELHLIHGPVRSAVRILTHGSYKVSALWASPQVAGLFEHAFGCTASKLLDQIKPVCEREEI